MTRALLQVAELIALAAIAVGATIAVVAPALTILFARRSPAVAPEPAG